MNSPFLTAHWANLLNVTFQVPPATLEPYVPAGVELDVQEGHAFASIVAFEFLDTRVKGLKIPFHVNFPEINLRFYVKYQGKRGVVFIKELVPRYCIAQVARRIYNEPYESTRMKAFAEEEGEELRIRHQFSYKGKAQLITARASLSPTLPSEDSVFHYFKEHDLGFGKDHKGRTLQYLVEHPQWEIYPLKAYNLNLDFGLIYGKVWEILHDAPVVAALLAKGSEVAVFPAKYLSTEGFLGKSEKK